MRVTGDGLYAGSVFGFPVFIAQSALMFAPVLALLTIINNASSGELARAFLQIAIVVVAVIVHELAHALTARALGVPVRHITLTWFGGYAALWVAPRRWREAVIAFAGPTSNLTLGAILLGALELAPGWSNVELRGADIYVSSSMSEPLLNYGLRLGAAINFGLSLFNLIPGLPLDGGHILRAGLATRMHEGRAHWLAAWCGVVIGVLVIGYAFWAESVWALGIGVLIVTVAWFERRAARYG